LDRSRLMENKITQRLCDVRFKRMIKSVFLCLEETMEFDQLADVSRFEFMPDTYFVRRVRSVIHPVTSL
jgi:hypothetical protein